MGVDFVGQFYLFFMCILVVEDGWVFFIGIYFGVYGVKV